MADRKARWRPSACCAKWALDYYLEFFSQFPKIRFAVDVGSICDDFSLELAKLSDQFLGIGSSEEILEDAKKHAKEKGSNLKLDFHKESLAEMLNRLEGNNRNCPDFLTACNAFANEKEQEEGVQLMSQIVRPGGGVLLLSVSILAFPKLDPAAFQELNAFFARANVRSGLSATSVDPEMMLDDQKLLEERFEVSVSRTELEQGLRNDPAVLKWWREDPEGLEKEMAAMLNKIWTFVESAESSILLSINCVGKFGRKIIF